MPNVQSLTLGPIDQAGTITCAVTVNPGDNLCLMAAIHCEDALGDCTGMTRDGQSLVEDGAIAAGTWTRVEVWRLVNPNLGTNTLTATVVGPGADRARLAVWVLEDVDQASPLSIPAVTNWGSGLSSSVDTEAVNPEDLVIDMLTLDAFGHTPVADGLQIVDYNTGNGTSSSFEMAASHQSVAVGSAMLWTWSTSCPFSHMAVIVKSSPTITQQFRPDADLATTGWATAPLWSKIDEASAGGDVITGVAS